MTNFFTVVKVALVLFMILAGFSLFRSENLTPAAPFGFGGILRGATSSFFGYLGYDEVCCLASEARDPRDMPRAVLSTPSQAARASTHPSSSGSLGIGDMEVVGFPRKLRNPSAP